MNHIKFEDSDSFKHIGIAKDRMKIEFSVNAPNLFNKVIRILKMYVRALFDTDQGSAHLEQDKKNHVVTFIFSEKCKPETRLDFINKMLNNKNLLGDEIVDALRKSFGSKKQEAGPKFSF